MQGCVNETRISAAWVFFLGIVNLDVCFLLILEIV